MYNNWLRIKSFSRIAGLGLLLAFPFSGFCQNPPETVVRNSQQDWVETRISSMTLEEKIGQLFMMPAYAKLGDQPDPALRKLVQKYHIGGIIMMQGHPEEQLRHLATYQSDAKIPLMIGQDAEWGLSMRLKGTLPYPKNMTLGAIRNDSLLYDMGKLMATQLRRAGVHINFAPVFDVNNNEANPVINRRSFGDNKYAVARKGVLLSHGLQAGGVMACAKHFPGHGDTGTDSHYDMPVLPFEKARLDTLELYPFSKAIEEGIGAVMVAHLNIPALDSTPSLPATLSPKIINGILRDSMEHEGLIFTDALNMEGISKYYGPGEANVQALLAGNDILLFPQDVEVSVMMIKSAVRGGKIKEEDLNAKVRRVLNSKYQLGLDTLKLPVPDSALTDINSLDMNIFRKRLYESAITLVKNNDKIVPLKDLHTKEIAYVQIGGKKERAFYKRLNKYVSVEPIYLDKSLDRSVQGKTLKALGEPQTVIVGLFDLNHNPRRRYGIQQQTLFFLKALKEAGHKVVLNVFGSPYTLKHFGNTDAILLAYEEDVLAQEAAATALFGGNPIKGKLPVSVSEEYQEGMGTVVDSTTRFGFAYPEELGMSSQKLAEIDSISNYYIEEGAMPGCALMVLRGNKIIYDKGFGRTYSEPEAKEVNPFESIYDLASVTKIAATTISIMQLVDQGWIDLEAPLKHYIPDAIGTNKEDITIRRLLQHNAGLPAWVPFYRNTFKEDNIYAELEPKFCSYVPTSTHTRRIAPSFYIHPMAEDSLWEFIWNLDVVKTNRVRYSDVGMILLGRVVEEVSNMSLDKYTHRLFFKPLGMDHTFFNPHEKNMGSYCPPTQIDTLWRKALIQGYVHDETAAILQGVSGHAGLFANTYDLAKLMLMLKNGGIYGGNSYLSDSIINVFTRKQLSNNRKGLGWDKPEIREGRFNPASEYCSNETFGHTGFTGTSVWVDPGFDLIYIFLSNRTFPFGNNKLLQRENVRVRIMDKIYESMFEFSET